MHNSEISKELGKLWKDVPEEKKARRILQCTIIAKMSEKRKSKNSQKVKTSEPSAEVEDNSELLAAAMAIGSSNRQNELQQHQEKHLVASLNAMPPLPQNFPFLPPPIPQLVQEKLLKLKIRPYSATHLYLIFDNYMSKLE